MKRKAKKLTQARLKEVLHYEPNSGRLTWLVSRGGKRAGDEAGHIMEQGYRIVGVDGELFLASDLAVLYMTGRYPDREVDHWDLDKANNEWENLREATPTLNCMNRRVRSDSSTGIKGVQKHCRKWRVTCRRVRIGSFDTIEEAQRAYADAASKAAGEFARLE